MSQVLIIIVLGEMSTGFLPSRKNNQLCQENESVSKVSFTTEPFFFFFQPYNKVTQIEVSKKEEYLSNQNTPHNLS
jgi:hypothetical protein